MTPRYVLAPQATIDLVEIWQYLKEHAGVTAANKVESAILERMGFWAGSPGAGHHRNDLTSENAKFFPVYSYLIVYRPETKPLQIAAILHGRRDLEEILKERL